MQIRLGYELIYNFPQPTPMILALNIHYSRASDIIIPDYRDHRSVRSRSAGIAMASATGAPGSWRPPGACESRPMR